MGMVKSPSGKRPFNTSSYRSLLRATNVLKFVISSEGGNVFFQSWAPDRRKWFGCSAGSKGDGDDPVSSVSRSLRVSPFSKSHASTTVRSERGKQPADAQDHAEPA